MTVRWTKDDHELTEDEHVKMSYETGSAELTLTNAQLSHAGKYVCEAQNRAGTQRCVAVLTVTGLFDPRVLTAVSSCPVRSFINTLVFSCVPCCSTAGIFRKLDVRQGNMD